MDLKQLIKEEEEECDGRHQQVDAKLALQSFLDRIPITSILYHNPNASSDLELKSDDCVRDAISLLYTNNVSGAPIVENVDSDLRKFVDRDIGFIEFSSMVLWSLEELKKVRAESKSDDDGLLSVLEQNSQIGQTKIGELAKSFLWEPFFPVNSNDTLFHVLLLFAKHPRLGVIPVVESSNSRVMCYINQNAVVQLLLQSSGLDWFDQIADKSIAEFGFEKACRFFSVYGDQTITDAWHILWKEETDGVPVIDQGSETLIGVVRRSDVHLLLDDDGIFKNRKNITIEQFIKTHSKSHQKPNMSTDNISKMQLSSCALLLEHDLLPRANTVITNQKSDSLKQVMKSLVASNSSQSFLVNESGKLEGILTLKDVISPFSPPSLDSRINGGGFFNAALEQADCHVKDGTLFCNN
ncbi:uncharacterized protein A4U43_C05F10330 [Asparagus officinalis]|uniref:CBS domain-containing protein n=1 Tax=Asparagus officinalis TaxID=4686 RepID=A0A5P1ERP6_ASPOF|nr:SNF1-related protein kinase regulatory subunit gamma-1-like [Asparagus officinalis]ONK68333.1 uncharacterized protein A4U43_C05F10330 [Asparagus officinalis]